MPRCEAVVTAIVYQVRYSKSGPIVLLSSFIRHDVDSFAINSDCFRKVQCLA